MSGLVALFACLMTHQRRLTDGDQRGGSSTGDTARPLAKGCISC